MGIRGVKVTTFSGFEMKAFGGFYYELKKKVMWHSTNIASTWSSAIPAILGTYLLIKWAENSYHHKVCALKACPWLQHTSSAAARCYLRPCTSARLIFTSARARLSFTATPAASSCPRSPLIRCDPCCSQLLHERD